MKYLIVAHRFHTNLYYNVTALQNKGNIVKVFVLYKGKSEYYENIDITQFKLSFLSRIFLKFVNPFKKNYLKTQIELRIQSPDKKFKIEIFNFKPDVILLKSYQEALAIKTLRIAKKINSKVLMLTQTDKTHIKNSKFLFKINIRLFKFLKVHSYVTPIKSNYEAFKNFGIENVFYVPFVYPVNLHFSRSEKSDKILRIISVGKYEKRKDHLLLIKAVNFLIKNNKSEIELNIYGEKSDVNYVLQLENYIQVENLNNQVFLHTNVSYIEICRHYSYNDLFILPSYSEPAAYSIVEAMANRLPVICSSENGTKCYIETGKNGYIFEAKNREDLVSKIESIIFDNDKLSEFSNSSYEIARKNHNPDNFCREIENIIGK